jgi:hypothetical protein
MSIAPFDPRAMMVVEFPSQHLAEEAFFDQRQPRPVPPAYPASVLTHHPELAEKFDKLQRPFFTMADIEENARRKAAGKKEIPLSPIAIEVVCRIDALFEIERSISGGECRGAPKGAADAEPAFGRNYVIGALSDSLDLMVRWVLRWLSGVRTRLHQRRDLLIVRMSQENFLWGAPRIHGELLKLGFQVSQATVSRYMPRRGYPPTQTWHTLLRNQAFAIGTTGLGEAGRLSDAPLALVRAWIARVVGCVSPRCGMASLAGLSSHRTDCRHIALPIVLIGAPFMVVACRSLLGPPL